jgi:hypothetical protein
VTSKQDSNEEDFWDWEHAPYGYGDRWGLNLWAADEAYNKMPKRYGGSASAQAQQNFIFMDGDLSPIGSMADTRLGATPSRLHYLA